MSQELPTTSYALLGLLSFGDSQTGYELKQRADRTLRFYWVSPAMSQVYTELARLTEHGLVSATDDTSAPARTTRRYQITSAGSRELRGWLETAPVEFPALKHPIALRLLLGHLVDPDTTRTLLEEYLEQLAERRADLQTVRDSLEATDTGPDLFRFPRMVADWGLDYYESERSMVGDLIRRVSDGSA